MDLRSRATADQVDRAKILSMRGLLNYQPYRFADDFYCGAGLSILQGFRADPPTVFCPSLHPSLSDYAARALVPDADRDAFIDVNDSLASLYDNVINQAVRHLGGVTGENILDVGCNAGYFLVRFAQNGARSTGYGSVDYTETIGLVNQVCGTNVEFKVWDYDGSVNAPRQFNIVSSIAVLVHMAEPLRHLAWLGSAAKRVLLVLTPCHHDDDLSVRFHTVNRYYDRAFPNCSDSVTMSRNLLRLGLEQMGFKQIISLDMSPMPESWQHVHLCLLGIR